MSRLAVIALSATKQRGRWVRTDPGTEVGIVPAGLSNRELIWLLRDSGWLREDTKGKVKVTNNRGSLRVWTRSGEPLLALTPL